MVLQPKVLVYELYLTIWTILTLNKVSGIRAPSVFQILSETVQFYLLRVNDDPGPRKATRAPRARVVGVGKARS